jgi:Lipopolysaccharide-assembly
MMQWRTLSIALFIGLCCGGCLLPETHILPERVRTVGIPMFRNRTMEYGVKERITDRVVREFINDGRLKVVRPGKADAVLECEILKYEISGRQYDDEDHAIGFLVDVELEAAMIDGHSGELLAERRVFRQAGIFFDSPQPLQQRQDDVFIRLGEAMISYYLEGW